MQFTLIKLVCLMILFIQRHINRETAKIAGTITESLRSIELVKSLGLTYPEIRRMREYNKKVDPDLSGSIVRNIFRLGTFSQTVYTEGYERRRNLIGFQQTPALVEFRLRMMRAETLFKT